MMISDLPLFKIYGAMARHAANSQSVSSTNIAHAGEPGFKASKLESFEAYIARTAAGEMPETLSSPFRMLVSNAPEAPNGNNVNLEEEIFSSAEALGQHNLALSVYTKSLDLLRTAIGKRG